jgi:phage host-nuclease inhibitor protein Gam|tara:strand:+ start:409 stop:672 length:264 start_codon:yes stop_codon:yes gene_type:complete
MNADEAMAVRYLKQLAEGVVEDSDVINDIKTDIIWFKEIQNQDRDYLEERMNEIANNVRDEYDRAIEDLEAKIERLQEVIDHLVEKS